MPARRRKARRKRGRMQIYGAAGHQLYKDVRSLKRLINVEFKFHDVQLTSVAISITPGIVQLSNIAQGDTDVTRDGSQLKVLSIQLAYQIIAHASSTRTFVRVLLVKDKQTNQAIYEASDLLSDVTTQDSIVSPYNRDNRRRFTVLYDKVHTFSEGGSQLVKFGRKFRQDQMLRYDATVGDITDLTQSSYSLMTISNESTNTPVLTVFNRLNYVDN